MCVCVCVDLILARRIF